MSWLSQIRFRLSQILFIYTILGCIQAGIGCLLVFFFKKKSRKPEKETIAYPSVTILKPLTNLEPLLFEGLQSFCEQDYPEFQIVFGVQNIRDPSIQMVETLKKQYPHLDIQLVINPKIHGTNRKISNLMNMLPYARHDYLLISDSDIHAPHRNFLKETIPLLDKKNTGLVTALYSGLISTPSLVQALASAHINYNFMPGVLLARYLGRQDCLGACVAIKRSLLEKIGGLKALLPYIADDAILGQLIRKQNLNIILAPSIVKTTVSEHSFKALYHHELRWNRTVFTLEPTGFIFSFLQLPLFWASLSLLFNPHKRKSWVYFISGWIFQSFCCMTINREIALDLKLTPLILPLRDWISAFIMMRSILKKEVKWRGQKMILENQAFKAQ